MTRNNTASPTDFIFADPSPSIPTERGEQKRILREKFSAAGLSPASCGTGQTHLTAILGS